MRWTISGLVFVILMNCSSAKKETKPVSQKNIEKAFPTNSEGYTRRTLAGKCRISATVKNIDTTLSRDDPDDICGKFPCRATITIDEVLGYGAGFNTKLPPGTEIEVKFQFTLAPSETALPGLQLELPGLKTGQHFIADLEENFNIGSNKKSFTIYRYELNQNTGVNE